MRLLRRSRVSFSTNSVLSRMGVVWRGGERGEEKKKVERRKKAEEKEEGEDRN